MGIEVCQRAETHGVALAFRDQNNEHSYADLLTAAKSVAGSLLDGNVDLQQARIAYLMPSSAEYVAVQWGIWLAGGIAVPLSHSATEKELEYTLCDSGVSRVLVLQANAEKFRSLTARLDIALSVYEEFYSPKSCELPDISSERGAMILYTSGTTSKPKGVLSSHGNIEAQINALVDAWQWRSSDVIPLFLPLHHIHGIINVMSCALWTGATVEPFSLFDSHAILKRVSEHAYTVFMAVPTIYVKLIQALEMLTPEKRSQWLCRILVDDS